jgi:hypothetical protein
VKVSILIACIILAFAAAPVSARTAAETVELAERLAALPDGPGRPALDAALAAYVGATSHGAVTRTDLLTVIDSALFSRNLKQIPIDYRLAHFSCSSSGKVNTA